MIKANELRIGNWVNYHDDDIVFKVIEISKLGIGVKNETEETWIEYDRFSPIKLTTEILEKCGFDNIDRTNIFVKAMHKVNGTKLKSLAVYLDEDTFTVAIVDYYTGVEKTDLLHLDYKYLHQLQNLYYSLVGIELEIV